MIQLFTTSCIYNDNTNTTLVYGQYSNKIKIISIIVNIPCKIVFCSQSFRPDFYIEVVGKIYSISKLVFGFEDKRQIAFEDISLEFPFENCDLHIDSNKSCIISTLCKNYSHRLDEWIQYNLKLGFTGIVIFNNDGNTSTSLNELLDNCLQ